MESPFANLFIALQAKIATDVPEVKWIDQEFGQLESYNDRYRPAVLFPCVLIDFAGWSFDESSGRGQTGVGRIVLRVGYPPFTYSSSITPQAQKEKALFAFEIEHKLYKQLHGWTFAPFSPFVRRRVDTEKREDDIRVRVIEFESNVKDGSAIKTYQTVARPDPVAGGDMVQ